MSYYVKLDRPGEGVLLLGNEAIARGAIEAGVHFAAAYPGTPSSEILATLARVAKDFGFHAEWSTNEKVAFEAAAAASWAGLRAMASMKQNGLSWIMDSIITISLSGTGEGGLVLIVADDPNAHSSSNEQDSRELGKCAEVPIMEPSAHQEAKDMIPYAFELSEKYQLPVMIRSVTRLGHSRSDVVLGEIKRVERKATLTDFPFLAAGGFSVYQHATRHEKLDKIREEFENSTWNKYTGPEKPSLLVITSGLGWQYSREAIKILGLEDEIGILKLGTTHPLPAKLIKSFLGLAEEVLFIEEIDPFIEENVRSIAVDMDKDKTPKFYGKLTGHSPRSGELNPNVVISLLAKFKEISYKPVPPDYEKVSTEGDKIVPERSLTFCPGCPHRATYWSILRAIRRNKNKGYVTGDIGCYALGVLYHGVMKTTHCMGASAGLASGFGVLNKFGLDDPIIAVMGDSTFYHACIPALINILYNNSNVTACILDNNATAMTGFQPHPGTGVNAVGDEARIIRIEDIVRGIGFEDVKVIDPYDIRKATEAVYKSITSPGSHVIIFRRECILITRRRMERAGIKIPMYEVDPDKCPGETCAICSQQFNCPACTWNSATNKAEIDQALCNGCGVCADICPYKAIHKVGE